MTILLTPYDWLVLRVYPDTGIVINREFVEALCIPSL